MSVTFMLTNAFNTKLLDCKNVIKYTSQYQILFNKIVSLLNKDLYMFKRTFH